MNSGHTISKKCTQVKIVPIGDGCVGKTSIVFAFSTRRKTCIKFEPTVFDIQMIMYRFAENLVIIPP